MLPAAPRMSVQTVRGAIFRGSAGRGAPVFEAVTIAAPAVRALSRSRSEGSPLRFGGPTDTTTVSAGITALARGRRRRCAFAIKALWEWME